MSYYTYILQCADGSLYTGWTTDLDARLAWHNAGKGAKYTRSHLPVRMVAYWQFDSRTAAMKEEFRIKRLTRQKKLMLIRSFNRGTTL